MGFLPPRPLRLDPRALSRRRLKKAALVAFIGAIGLGFCVGCAFLTRELIQERRLWNQGAEGRVLQYSGKVEESRLVVLTLLYDYKLDIRWVDAQGKQHKGPTSFSRVFSAIPKDEDPTLRYDPSAPDRFVLSWAAQGGLARDGMAILCGAMALLMVGGTVSLVRGERRRLQALRICAEDGDEVLGRVEKTWQYKGTHYVHYRFPDEPRLRKYQGEAPLLVTHEGAQHVLALRSPRAPDAPFLVEADLRSFDLSPEERTRIAGAVQTITLTG